MTEPSNDELRRRAMRVGSWSEIEDVRLFSVSSNLDELPMTGDSLSYRFDSDIEMQYVEDDGGLIVSGNYDLEVKGVQDGADTSDWDSLKLILRLEFTLAALFRVSVPEGVDPLSNDELDAFARSTGNFALHPYVREFIADVTGRCGLPQLHIAIIKYFVDSPETF